MRYQCEDCGEIFCAEDVRVIKDGGGDKGEDWNVCPHCGSDCLEKVAQCDDCGKYVDPAELVGGKCPDCVANEAEKVDQVKQYGAAFPAEVEINGLFAYVYSSDEINELLAADFAKLPEYRQKQYCRDFIKDDPMNFIDWFSEVDG